MYETKPFFERICLPIDEKFAKLIFKNFNGNKLSKWFSDLKVAWPIILLSFFLAVIFGFVYMVILRYHSGTIVWFSIIFFFIFLIILASLCYSRSVEYDTKGDEDNSTVFAFLALAILIIIVLSAVGFICLYKKIRLAIGVI